MGATPSIEIARIDPIGIRVRDLARADVLRHRDPDLNVVELRGRNEDLASIGGVVEYVPQN